MIRSAVLVGITLACIVGRDLRAQVRIPPVPPNNSFVADYAKALDPKTFARLGQAQKTAFEQHGTPVVVAVIWRRADYGGASLSIEDFAKQWFNVWRIGTLDLGAQGANKGILLLVCLGDREARIELGAQWDSRWNTECERIMQEVIIPEFKQARNTEGICRGVEELVRMAGQEPSQPPPRKLFGPVRDTINRSVGEYVREPLQHNGNPWGWGWSALLILGGMVLAGVGWMKEQKLLVWIGISLLMLGISWLVLLLFAAARAKGSGDSSWSGGSFGGYSGGGFSGGFSGGGGASGSW